MNDLNHIIFVLVGTSILNNKMFWEGCYWSHKLSSARMYKSFNAIHKIKEREMLKADKRWHEWYPRIGSNTPPKQEHLLVKDIQIHVFELFPLGEKTEEDIDEFQIRF